MKSIKLINEFSFENKDTAGYLTKIIVQVKDNGIVIINRFTVVPHSESGYKYFKQYRNMFGKKVMYQCSSFRLETLKTIGFYSQKAMSEAGVKLSDLV